MYIHCTVSNCPTWNICFLFFDYLEIYKVIVTTQNRKGPRMSLFTSSLRQFFFISISSFSSASNIVQLKISIYSYLCTVSTQDHSYQVSLKSEKWPRKMSLKDHLFHQLCLPFWKIFNSTCTVPCTFKFGENLTSIYQN
jgi:hypothetical protein